MKSAHSFSPLDPVLIVMSKTYLQGSECKKPALNAQQPSAARMQPRGMMGANMPSNGAFTPSWSDLFPRKQDQCLFCEQTLSPEV